MMGVKSCKIDVKAKTITLVLDLQKPRASGSGKNMILASTGGIVQVDAEFDGQPVKAGINVMYKPADEESDE